MGNELHMWCNRGSLLGATIADPATFNVMRLPCGITVRPGEPGFSQGGGKHRQRDFLTTKRSYV